MFELRKTATNGESIQYDINEAGLVTFPQSISKPITRIPACTFEGNRDVFVVKLPHTLRVIEDRAFSCCGNLWSTKLLDGLEEIGDYAFSGSSLGGIYVPKSVKRIGKCAFASSPNIAYVHIMGQPSVESKAFANLPNLDSVYLADPFWEYEADVFRKKHSIFAKNKSVTFYVAEGSCDPEYAQWRGYLFASPSVVYGPSNMGDCLFPPRNVLSNKKLSDRERRIYEEMGLL